MNNSNYAASHSVLKLSAKRFEQSPYADKYADENTLFGLYCRRFYPLSLGQNAIEQYWKLRTGVMLFDVPEKPLDIRGPDALALLERVFSRRIDTLKNWRARYAIACTPQGGILMDGVLIRLAADHFWYVQADGEFETWLLAHAEGLNVKISDPHSRVLQIQGPKSMAVLRAATNGNLPDDFGYFHAGKFDFDGQELLVTRTGWTGELGWEIYCNGDATNHFALWDHLMRCGKSQDMTFSSAESMGIRRIEAGILDYGTDIDISMTPYEAGVGAFVDLSKADFVGRNALQSADKTCLLLGLSCASTTPFSGLRVFHGDRPVGKMKVGAWTPYLDKGIGFVHFDAVENWLGRSLTLLGRDGKRHDCEVVTLPFFDAEKKIPRGLEVADINL